MKRGAKMCNLKQLRKSKGMTQNQAAQEVGISLRSYKSYENDPEKQDTLKYRYIVEKLYKINMIDEEHGILDREDITLKCSEVLKKYDVDFCYLFGSYAKNRAKPNSDVDLLICCNVHGLKFYGLVEEIRNALNKKVDVLKFDQLKDNLELTKEVLKDGIKIYG